MDIILMDKSLDNIDDIYKVMVTHSPNTIAILSLDAKVIFANPALHKFTGYELKDLENVDIFDLIREKDHQNIQENFLKVISGEIVEDIEYKFKIKNNSYLDLVTDAVPIKDENDK